jgi:ribonuclease R
MLTANETVAEKFYWLNAPFIFRVHEKPDEEKITDLNKSLYDFGYRIKGKKDDVKPKAFSDILEDVKGKEEEKVVSNLILRTLKIAKYEAENKGHFGIASKYYCHFTSPIRRYPDLFIHRVISKYLECNYNVGETFKEKFNTQAIKYSITSSETEQVATKAERESEKVKMCEYMEKHIGEEYDGIVSSITNFGMFIELPSTIEGLVHFTDMGNEYFIYNESNRTLIGEKTGRVFKMGDKVRVKVIYASKMEKVIDFKLIDKKDSSKK